MDARSDFLIIGSGIAGLRAAIALADAGDVVVLTKADASESNTGYAQGGIAAAVGPDDSPALHIEDTLAAGDGLCDDEAVRVLIEDGLRYVRELVEWGAAFDRDSRGTLALTREAAHRVRRVLHAQDATGREIGRVLWSRVAGNPRIRVLQGAEAVELIVSGGICIGAVFADAAGSGSRVIAAATLLATGGAGQLYRDTTNPAVATGDGVAMAFLAGAAVMDLEFVQFHPTVLSVAGAPRFLLSEALRGEGAVLVNDAGEPFMTRYDPAGDLAPRDVVARGLAAEMARTGAPVCLSMAHLDAGFVRGRFPTIAAVCARAGLDLARDRIPVSPAAHYVMGGVETDLHGRTSLPGLYAAGEVACTGAHGANRLASNSLLEGLVFGARAAAAMIASPGPPVHPARRAEVMSFVRSQGSLPGGSDVRELMWRDVGLLRTGDRLAGAVETLGAWAGVLAGARGFAAGHVDAAARRTASLVLVGLLVARAALRREESRGAHFRTDCPARDDARWRTHVTDSLAR
ncbi:MAG: L-aspartate oxidase [Acidimicrobiia bacterium]|nr:L-aspartate oxidase [Acidimicrobiia bacterium]